MAQAHEASGAEMVTVAVRRVNIARPQQGIAARLHRHRRGSFILPNTAGCYTAEEAVRTARLGREAGLSNWVKLEVIGDEKTLFPDNEALLEATRMLVKEGFIVLPYTIDDPVRLPQAGGRRAPPRSCRSARPSAPVSAFRMPTTSASSSSRRACRVIVDAGVGTASDAAVAMELGADAVLMNTAIAGAHGSGRMAARDEAGGRGRGAWRSSPAASRGRCTRRRSSPVEGLVGR